MTTQRGHRLEVPLGEPQRRVDQFLAEQLPDLSRSRLKSLIEEGKVLLGGARVKAAHRLKGGEVIELSIPAPTAAVPQAEALPVTVIFEDQDLIVVDKAPGMVVHPGAGHGSGTLVNALLHHVKDLGGVGGELRPGIVHRLDKDTSGLMVVAKHDEALVALQRAFKSREVDKTYLALVHGRPPASGTFQTLYGRHPTQRTRFSSRVKVGKPAVTHFTTTQTFAAAARVEVRLETGRTHQIRVHFSDVGFPLISDELYGNKSSRRPEIIGRQALHAFRLSFCHPRTGERVSLEAKIPKDFETAERRLRAEGPGRAR